MESRINCSYHFGEEFAFGTEKGVALVSDEGKWRFLKGEKKKILQVKVSQEHRVVIVLAREELKLGATCVIRSFPFAALDDPTIKSKKIEGTSGARVFDISDENPDFLRLVFANEERILELHVHNNGAVQEKRRIELKRPCTTLRLLKGDIFFASEAKFCRVAPNAEKSQGK